MFSFQNSFIWRKCSSLFFTKRNTHLSKDIINYIASEFLYYNDAMEFICCSSHCGVQLYQMNFEKLEIKKYQKIPNQKNNIEIDCCYFNQKISKRVKIDQITLSCNTNKTLQQYFKDIHSCNPKHLQFGVDREAINVDSQSIHFTKNMNKTLLENLPNSIETIKFTTWMFDAPLSENLPSSLQKIKLNDWNNQLLPKNLPPSLKTIIFGNCYDQPLPNNLPNSIEKLVFDFRYDTTLPDNLPKSLKCIKFGFNYNKALPHNLPDSIEKIVFGSMYNQPLPENLPKSLKYIKFDSNYNQPLPKKLPNHLETIIFSHNFNHCLPDDLPHTLQFMEFGFFYNQPLPKKIPKSLKCVKINTYYFEDYNQRIATILSSVGGYNDKLVVVDASLLKVHFL